MTWDYTFDPCGVDHTREELLVTNFTPKRGLGTAIAFHKSEALDNAITDALGAAEVVRLLGQQHDKPFFLAYGFYRPHVPWIVPKAYFEEYPLGTIEPYPFDPSELMIAPPAAYWTRPSPDVRIVPSIAAM